MDSSDEVLEPTLDVESTPAMEPVQASAPAPRRYWQAQEFARTLEEEFQAASDRGDEEGMRERFYALARYYTRTVLILREAVADGRQPLTRAALSNLLALHRPLDHMHAIAKRAAPVALTLRTEQRRHLMDDLIVHILREAPRPLTLEAITESANDLDILADASEAVVAGHLAELVSAGYVTHAEGHYELSGVPHTSLSLDQAMLETLTGSDLYTRLEAADFHGLFDVTARRHAFRQEFARLTGFDDETAALFVAVAEALAAPHADLDALTQREHSDLIGSGLPRPYQYQAYAVFRGFGYQGQVIEAPTGSGKTMIGMMCIQDWLRTLPLGQSILVLVPTVNYQQQWLGELCYHDTGLHLSPDLVYAGTPTALQAASKRMGGLPLVVITTYTALAQLGSAAGKGGFDRESVEEFLQGANAQYVILDEVHKLVEDPTSVSADVARVLTSWQQDGSLLGLIGFSGTAAAYRDRFAGLGLQLAYTMPAAELIAYGFVAPYAEVAVPFAYSDREKRVSEALGAYKECLRRFVALVGSANWRRWLAAVATEERLAIARDVLRMYAGRPDRDAALAERLKAWAGGAAEVGLNELPLVTIVQVARGWSDADAVREAGASGEALAALLAELAGVRQRIAADVRLPNLTRRLQAPGFGTALDVAPIRALLGRPQAAAGDEAAVDALATTICGFWHDLSSWYLRVGEGRVDTIRAIVDAERAVREVHGVIVFDTGKRIRWQAGVAVPGYSGVGGVFAQMLGDERFVPMAVLSGEVYLPWSESDPLAGQIAGYVRQHIMLGEVADALFGLATQGLGLSDAQLSALRSAMDEALRAYVAELGGVRSARIGEFGRRVLTPLRRAARAARLGPARSRLLARLSLRHYHVRRVAANFFDYAMIARDFERARLAELEQSDGTRRRFCVVRMPAGERKQLVYDLTSRVVDADDLPVNMIIVSPWARTGWNVIKPNVLIDATATRNVTAWQQLRGRAMRALRTWTNDCYRLVLLLGSRSLDMGDGVGLPEDVQTLAEQLRVQTGDGLSPKAQAILAEVHARAAGADAISERIASGNLAALSEDERRQLITELMLGRNKVTHIYELLKAYGSTYQVRYDRGARRWARQESIAAKHEQEYSVDPLTGAYGPGEGHAPLLYPTDPRQNVPSELRAHLESVFRDRDAVIVRGWQAAVVET